MKHPAILAAVAALFFASSCATQTKDHAVGDGWDTLFNGKDIDDWIVKIYGSEAGDNFANTFRVADGVIRVDYGDYPDDFGDRFGHLYYQTPYGHYHLKLEYRFVGELYPGAPPYTLRNSGVMLHSQDPRRMPKDQNWPISVEMQFLGGLGDGQPRPTGNMCSPGTHIVHNGQLLETHCINSSSATYDGDQWVRAELIVLGDSLVTHIIEGDTVLRYSKPQIGGNVVAHHRPEEKTDGKPLKEGFIALQSEGQPVEFRNIYLKDLSATHKKEN